MIKHHARATPTHDATYVLAFRPTVTMYCTSFTSGLAFTKPARVEPPMGISEQFGVGFGHDFSLELTTTVQADHLREELLFVFYATHIISDRSVRPLGSTFDDLDFSDRFRSFSHLVRRLMVEQKPIRDC